MPAKGRHIQNLQERNCNGNPFLIPVPGHFHPGTTLPTHPHPQFVHQMKKHEPNNGPCECILLVTPKWQPVITVRCHRDFTKLAEWVENQRLRRMNGLPWQKEHRHGGRAWIQLESGSRCCLPSGAWPWTPKLSPRSRNTWLSVIIQVSAHTSPSQRDLPNSFSTAAPFSLPK